MRSCSSGGYCRTQKWVLLGVQLVSKQHAKVMSCLSAGTYTIVGMIRGTITEDRGLQIAITELD
jgi:hypothetical protein